MVNCKTVGEEVAVPYFNIHFRRSPGNTDKYNGQSLVLRPRFELGTCRIQVGLITGLIVA